MSLFDRLFGEKPSPPAATSVVIEPELAATLTASGESLQDAVHSALRSYLVSLEQPKPAEPAAPAASATPERVPFWLERGSERDEALEDKLRDRVINRRDTESDAKA